MTTHSSGRGVSGLGTAINRAQGLPVVSDDHPFGASSTVYADLFNLEAYGDRIFTGMSIYNPDASNKLYIAMGAAFCGSSKKVITVPANFSLTFDEMTFGPSIIDQVSGVKCSHIRALLSSTTGTAATGTIGYAAANPTDGMKITINGQIYEFLVNRNAGDGLIPVAIAASADLTYTALVTAINANEQGLTASINTGTDTVTLTSNYSGAYGNYAFADGGVAAADPTGATFSGSGNMASGAGGTIPVAHIW